MISRVRKHRAESGYALLASLIVLMLMSTLLVCFILVIVSSQQQLGMNNDQRKAFYAAEAGMEKITADLGTLFQSNYSPAGAQLNLITKNPPQLTNIQFTGPAAQVQASSCAGSSATMTTLGITGYQISFPADLNGNPVACDITVKSGPFQGMNALATDYTLTVTAETSSASEVKLERTTQTVAIPAFQFGIFSQVDLGFHAGPDFDFGGRVHTNGNLFLAEGTGATLTFSDRVTAALDVIRTNLMNGQPLAAGGWNGTVRITTSPGSASYRPLQTNEGSLVGGIGSGANPNWPNISLGASNYAGNLRSGSTGAVPLNMAIVANGGGATQTIDLIRRPLNGEAASITGERYFAQASLRVLLSDDPNDIMNLPCIDGSTQPFRLDDLAQPVANWTSANATALKNAMIAAGTTPLPLAASGAGAVYQASEGSTTDGYWYPAGQPLIQGYIKIEAQLAPYALPCAAWKDVTQEVLSLGYAGRNINPATGTNSGQSSTTLLLLPGAQVPPSACLDPHPNALIRLERIRDNPSSIPVGTAKNPVAPNLAQACGVDPATGAVQPSLQGTATDFWPNALFDTREGTLRDVSPAGNLGGINYSQMVMIGGVMNYVEVDAANLGRWFTGAIGVTGPTTADAIVAPDDFAVYISDRRQNYTAGAVGAWPPLSPQGHETGEYGFSDFVNPGNGATGCPNNSLDTPGEDLAGTAQFYTYGQDPRHAMNPYGGGFGQMGPFPAAQLLGAAITFALTSNPLCAVAAPSNIWPGVYVVHANEARQNPNFFFRRAIKVRDGNLLQLGGCPGNVVCGLTIATENPAYLEGDFNSNSAGGGFGDAHVATSIAADALTLLSNNWNDVNSFASPYSQAFRGAASTYYRTAVIAGKGVGFPWIPGTAADMGSDGGTHNFLRYIENWGGQTLNYRGSLVSLYYNRQAIGIYKCCTTVYSPPTRAYKFDTDFLTPSLLPPRTPMFRDVNTTGFSLLLLASQ